MSEKDFPVKHMNFNGIDLEIENPAGTVRSGVDKQTGKPWSINMKDHYGRIPNTDGRDGDMVDIFINARIPLTDKVFKVTTKKKDGSFDETKWMLGFADQKSAQASFWEHYDAPADYFGFIEQVPFSDFKLKVQRKTISEKKNIKIQMEQVHSLKSIIDKIENERVGKINKLQSFAVGSRVKYKNQLGRVIAQSPKKTSILVEFANKQQVRFFMNKRRDRRVIFELSLTKIIRDIK